MNRTNVWEYDETKELLNIILEQDSLKHFHAKTYTNTEIYKKIEEELRKRGYPNKNEKQIENRWKNLKKRYRQVKKIDCKIGTERSLCPFYDELNNMLESYYESSNKNWDWDDDEVEEGPPPPKKRNKWEFEEVKDKVPVKRNIWEYEETKALLNIMIEQESLKHFNGKLYKNAEIYKNIERALRKRGFHNKNDKQIEHRWKNLKKEFCKVKKMNSNGNEINLWCPFYNELDNMLSNRTSTSNSSDNGIDTSKSIFFEEQNDGLFLQEPSSPAIDVDKMFNVQTSPKQSPPSSSPTATATSSGFQKRTLRGKSIYNNHFERLGQKIKKTQEELTKQFFEDQKRLIDYEYSLYLKSEEEFQKKFDESTRKILEDSTKTFLQGLQAILQKNNTSPSTSDISEFIKFSTEDCQ